MLRKSAFTLLETMIALGIVVTVIGAGAAINKVLFTGGLAAEDTMQAASLADEGIALVSETQSFLQNSTRTDKTLATFFKVPAAGSGTSSFVVPYSAASTLQWCVKIGSGTSYTSADQSVNCATQSTNATSSYLQSTQIGPHLTAFSGEMVAVNRKSTDARRIIDATTYKIGGDITTNDALNWDYYTRVIQMKRITMFTSPTGGSGGTPLPVSVYQVTVTVTNRLTGTKAVRNQTLTDWVP